jgi:ABC-type transporter Mla subunit MlaD
MRRALVLIGIIGLGVLVGFLVRLVWPHRRGSVPEVYAPPSASGGLT